MKFSASSPFLFLALLFRSTVGTSVDDGAEQQQWNQHSATRVRKMTEDEGEKFYFEYWDFGGSSSSLGNASFDPAAGKRGLQPALARHTGNDSEGFDLLSEGYSRSARRALAMLLGRDFKCPTGTVSCTSIGHPDSCCDEGDKCEIVQDTGLGTVGCCPAGENCGGTVSSCAQGYTSCPSRLGGGCCIPGYSCVSQGCVFVSTYTVTEQSTTFVSSSTVSTVSAEPTTSRTSVSSVITSTAVAPVPPVRPTTEAPTTTITSAATTTAISTGPSVCPTGFYACSAVYHGGCCRTGRDCDTTSCPTTSSTTIIDSDGVTVAVPTGSAATTASAGSCATGWYSCAASVGGGCCPSGFACGASCTATASGTATGTVGKGEPGIGGRFFVDMYFCGLFALGTWCLSFLMF